MARENLCPNPSFAYGLSGWMRYTPSALRIASDPAPWGGHDRQSPTYLVVDVPSALEGQVVTPGFLPVSAGQSLAVSALIRTSPGIGLAVRVEWMVGDRKQVTSAPMLLASSAEGDRPTWVHVAPAGATQARVRFEVRTSGARDNKPGWVHIDDVMVVAASAIPRVRSRTSGPALAEFRRRGRSRRTSICRLCLSRLWGEGRPPGSRS